jgi:predicted NBD/HSP70 family sugar kinase
MNKNDALNASRMKSRNYRRVLEELRISPFSRSDLSRRMGLTRAAISLIVDTMLHNKILVEGETIFSRTAGRSATALHWNNNAFYCIGVAIRRGYFAVGLYDFCGNMISVERKNISVPYNTASSILDETCRMIKTAIDKYEPPGTFLGIGIGAPGPIDTDMGIIDVPPHLEILHKAPIVHVLREQFNCPVILANDASSHALAELCYGVKDTYNSFAVIEVTGGIGAGIVLNGKPVPSAFGNGNEIGHTTINIYGEQCQCGNVGCAELYATMDVVVKRAMKKDSRLSSWKAIVDYANEGLKTALEIIREEAFYLATLAINLLNTLDINAIIFNGRDICYKPELILNMIREQIPERLLFKKHRRIDLLTSTITEDADTLSAANLAIENFLKTFLTPECHVQLFNNKE